MNSFNGSMSADIDLLTLVALTTTLNVVLKLRHTFIILMTFKPHHTGNPLCLHAITNEADQPAHPNSLV